MQKLLRKCQRGLAFVLAFALVMSSFLQSGPAVVIAASELAFVASSGYEEGAFAKWSAVSGADSYKAYVSSNGGAFTEINSAMIRKSGDYYRVDEVGLAAGTAQIKVEALSGSSVIATSTTGSLNVTNYDRSGYAHFNNTEGVGAYNDDGTLKSNAIVLYVTDSNKDTVSVTSKDGTKVTGIGHILNSVGMDTGSGKCSAGGKANNNAGIIAKLAADGTPLVVRIIGNVTAPDGLTAKASVDYGGTVKDNGNMARIKDGLNITIEGIGSDATMNGWGIHFMSSSSKPNYGKNFEVRNISFRNVPEDCIGMEGVQEGSTLTAPVERCWVHDCAFYAPTIANPAESDKDGGDGACDFKRGQYFTMSYCYYEGYHKTNLVGASNDNLQFHLSYHHNYWKNCDSRGPLARQANIHMYNNIFEGQTSYCMNPRADAYIFSEYNMFLNCKNPVQVDSGAVKSYKDTFTSCTGDNDATIVADKSTKVNTSCQYANFDTNSSLSYIPSEDYALQTDLTEVKKVLTAYTGPLQENPVSSDEVSTSVILEDRIPSEAVVLPYSQNLNKSYVTTTKTTVDNIIFNVAKTDSSNLTVGSNTTGQDIVFRVNTAVNITVGAVSGTYLPVLCNESGIGLLTGSGTVTNVPAGVYYIQSGGWDPGSAKYKEAKIESLAIEAYDPNAETATEYTITVQNDGNGTASAAPAKAIKGTTVTLTATPNSGYEFDSWQVVSGGASISNNKFVMPASNVVVNALFKESTGSGSGSGSGGTGGGTGSGDVPAGTGYVHNFTTDGTTAGYFTFGSKANLSTSKGTVTYNGMTLTQALKMESGTTVSFTAATAGTLVLVFNSANSSDIKVDGTTYSLTDGILSLEVKSGSHTIEKAATSNLFYVEFVPEGSGSGDSGDTTVAVTGVSLDKTTATLTAAGQTVTLTATVAPDNATNKNVAWSSSNSAVATVNNGVVTAVANGTATITVTTEDGSKTATCAVTVEIPTSGGDDTVAVTGVSLDKTSLSLTSAGQTATLTATVAPSNATNKTVTWSSSDNAVATVNNGVVTAVANGTATITAKTADGNKTATCTVTVSISTGGGSGSGGSGSVDGDITVTENMGYQEGAYVEWSPVAGATGYKAYVAKSGGEFTRIDDKLIRKYPDCWRVDAVGLAAGTYDIKIEAVMDNGSIYTTVTGLTVIAHERYGFAWVNGTASGAYNEDGTLKSNAKVVYITSDNKDDMMTEIDAYADGSYPLCLRLIGNIEDASNLDKGDLLIGECDSVPGITIEGIGEDATANGWGIRIKNSSNVEIRNLGFMNCDSSEGDAVGLQQGNDHVWVHDNDFFYGDAGSDADQAKGDGALDTKKSLYVTHSYNHFYDTGKTHLNGNKESSDVLNYITYHHNWYDHSDSRHPLVRCSTAVHCYNNLYDGVAKYGMIARLGSSIFAESNYFKDTKSPILISQQGTDIAAGEPISSDAGGMIKAYGNVYDNTTAPITHKDSSTNFDCYEASSKTESVPSSYKTVKGGTSYSNFDTSSSMYSYVSESAANAKATVEKYSGRVNGGDFDWDFSDPSEDTNYAVNTALKSALTNYSSSLVSVGGFSGDSSGSGSTGGDTAVKVTGVSLNNTSLTFSAAGQTATLTATVTPSNATNKALTWDSSNESVATVNNGVVTAVANGTATITVVTVDGSYLASCAVTVNITQDAVAVTGVTLDSTSITLTKAGQVSVLNATVAPDNASNKAVVWSTSDKNVATVSGGTVTAVANGTATITVTTVDGNFTATCAVTVNIPQSGGATTGNVYVHNFTEAGKTSDYYSITGNLSTSKGSTSYEGLELTQCLKMESSTNISFTAANAGTLTLVFDSGATGRVKVDGTTYSAVNGVVTVELEAGSHTIIKGDSINLFYMEYAEEGAGSTAVAVTGVTLDKTSTTLTAAGQAVALTATVAPGNAANQNVTWTSSDSKVATVSNAGVVVAVANGTTTITVTTEDGGYTATCAVTVAIPVAVTGVTLDKTSATLTAVGQTATLAATVAPANAANKAVTWTSSNTAAATVANGVVTAVANGTTTITATTADGGYTATCEVTVNIPTKVTGVTLDKSTLTFTEKGQAAVLVATVAPANADNKNVTWTSSNTSVATVSSAGVVVAVSNGTSTITVKTEDGSYTATCEVTVAIPVAVTGVTLDKNSLAFTAAGQTATLTATVAPGDAADKSVTWTSSNKSVATVVDGVVTAVASGTTTITVTTNDGGYKTTCEVTVDIPTNVTGVTLDKTSMTLTEAGQVVALIATIKPSNADNQNVTWESSNTSVATVSNAGVVVAVANGTTTITVKTEDGNFTATCEVTVEIPVAVTGVELNKNYTTLTAAGQTETLTATVNPSDAANKNVTWESSNTSVATVVDGVVTAVANGTTVITVTTEDGEFEATCEVTVTIADEGDGDISVTAVTLDKTGVTLTEIGATASLTATVTPLDATNKGVTWESSNTSVATVDAGVVTAVDDGTAVITVTTKDGGYKATCEVTVKTPVAVTGVTLDKESATLTKAGQTVELTATVAPENADNKNVTWTTTNGSVAVVSSTGIVTAVSNGTTTITVTTKDGSYTANCEITVAIPVSATDVALDKTSITLTEAGQTTTLAAIVAPSNAANKNVTWESSDTSVATVSTDGVVTAVSNGTATITVTTVDGSHKATCTVTVAIPVAVKGISLNKTSVTFNSAGQALGLEATVAPSNADNKNIVWTTSNGSVAVVSSSGVVTAVGNGTATITVTTEDGNYTAECEVTVEIPVSVNGVRLDKTSATLTAAGQTTTLTATVSPSTAGNKAVTWESSNTSVATVVDGVVTAVSNGTAVITVTTKDGSYNAVCVVTVAIPVSVTGVTLDKSSATLTAAGETITLTATVNPANANNSTVYWSTSNGSVAVVSNGVVTAVGNGTATITVTTEDGNKSATCEVTVAIPVKATGIVLDKTSATLTAIGATTTVTATVTPSNATDKSVRWISTDETVATVADGVVTAVGEGTAIIVATTVDGGYTANFKVTVSIAPDVVAVTGVSLDKTSVSFTEAGKTETLTATVAPENADNKSVTWTSSDNAVATVADGVVTAVGNGTATITVTTTDGGYSATCTVTVEIAPEVPVDPVQAFVERMYTVALGRVADEAGVANWVAALRVNTHDGANIAEEFILGEEFALRGLSDEEYVDTLYHTFFNREADQGGKELWLAVLASGQSRGYVLSNFVNLPEFTMLCASYGIERGVMLDNGEAVNPGIPQFVKRLYTIVLGREAENEGLYNNVLALVVGALNAEQVAKNFFTSEEYLMKNKDAASFVTDLYAVFMNRQADEGGLSFWVSCLEVGMTRDEVLSEFAKSEEFKMIAASYGLQ